MERNKKRREKEMALKKRAIYVGIVILLIVFILLLVSKIAIKDFKEFFGFEFGFGDKEGRVEKSEVEGERVVMAPGDGIIDAGEECDDGNSWGGDGCSSSLTIERNFKGDKIWDCSVAGQLCSWIQPIGIPKLGFGIEESYRMYDAPANRNPALTYTQNSEGGYYTHYVEGSNPACSDAEAGTPAIPRCTIPNNLVEGSVVEVHGTYSYAPQGYQRLISSGTLSQPIFIRGESAANKPTVTQPWQIVGSYMIFENLHFNVIGTSKLNILGLSGTGTSSNVVIRYSDIEGAHSTTGRGSGIGMGGDSATTAVSNIIVFANVIHDNGDWLIDLDQDNHGVGVGDYTNNVWVVDNEMYHNSGDGIQINAGTPALMSTTHHIYVSRNKMHENKQYGATIKQAQDVIISDNEMFKHRPSDSSDGGGIIWIYGPERVWMLNNHIYDSENGILTASVSGPGGNGPGEKMYIIGNVIHNIHRTRVYDPYNPWKYGSGFRLTDDGSTTRYVINNIVYDADSAVTSPRVAGPILITNNIFSNIGESDIIIESATLASRSMINYTFFDNPARILWGSYSAADEMDLNEFKTNYPGQCKDCQETDPLFKDSAANDFHLTSESPARNAGDNVLIEQIAATYQQLYGEDIRKDLDRVARPQENVWDIGAYEYNPPTSLTYEGYGSVTRGALDCPTGYTNYIVTSLADSGPGTLRDAVSQGCRYITFSVGGDITLAGNLDIRQSYITIDGSSAPSPGITILQPNYYFTGITGSVVNGAVHDIIIHHLRHDGMTPGQHDDTNGDIWTMDGETQPVYNIILDHISATSANDGIFDMWGDVKNVSISWNLMIDTFAVTTISYSDTSLIRDGISIYHNLYARNGERQIRLRRQVYNVDFVNNIVYGWARWGGIQGSFNVDNTEASPSMNIEGNNFYHVPGFGTENQAIFFDINTYPAKQAYFNDNVVPAGETNAVSTISRLAIPSWAEVTHYAADSLGSNVIPYVGTNYRTPGEQALLDQVAAAIGGTPPAENVIYVDLQIPVASCTTYNVTARNCVGGSATAYQTLQGAANVVNPGDRVRIRAGDYREAVTITRDGAPGAPITFEGYLQERPVFIGQGFEDRDLNNDGDADGPLGASVDQIFLEADYIHIRGIEIMHSTKRGLLIRGSYNLIEDVIAHDNWLSNFLINPTEQTVEGNIIRNVEGYLSRHGSGANMDHAVPADPSILLGLSRNNTIEHSLFYQNGYQPNGSVVLPIAGDPAGGGNSDGMGASKDCNDQIGRAIQPTDNLCPQNTYRGNVAFNNADDGMDVSFSHSTISGNFVFNNGPQGKQGIKILRPGAINITFVENTFLDNLDDGMQLRGAAHTVHHNSALRNIRGGIRGISEGYDFRNNLAAFSGVTDIIGSCTGCSPNWAEDVNGNPLLADANRIIDTNLPSGTIAQRRQFIVDQFQAAFTPQPTSPLVDNGAFIAGYHCPVSGNVNPNQAGCRMWYGSAPDIGAYEYLSGEPVACDVAGDCAVQQCKIASCVSNQCVYNNAIDGSSCDDGLYCNGVETCNSGTCQTGTARCTGAGEVCNEANDRCDSCTFTNAFWNTASSVQDGIVTLTVEGSNCEGKQVDFNVREDDGIDYELAKVQPGVGTFSGGRATTTWNAEWQCDGQEPVFGICAFGEPEYYFVASLAEDSLITRTSNAPELVVHELLPTCGNNLTQGTEECDDGNTNNNDACTNSCLNAICGDGYCNGNEVCGSCGDCGACADVTAPSLNNVRNGSVSNASAEIRWNTDEESNPTINYGKTIALEVSLLRDSFLLGEQMLLLTGLDNGTVYYYQISACDVAGNCNQSEIYNFTTIAGEYIDNSRPVVLLNKPENGESVSSNSITFSYTPNDLSRINNCTLFVGSQKIIEFNVNNGINSFVVNLANGEYYWNISCVDSYGNIGESETWKLIVNYVAPADTGTTSGPGGGGGISPKPVAKPINMTNESIEIVGGEEKIVLGEELSFIEIKDVEEAVIVDLYGNSYKISFALSGDGRVIARVLNGDYIIPRGEVLPIGLGREEIYVGIVESDIEGAKVVMGLNKEKVVGEIGEAGKQEAGGEVIRISGWYVVFGVLVLVIIVGVIVWWIVERKEKGGKEQN